MVIAKVGKRGTLVIPAKERRKAMVEEGDYVEVVAKEKGLLVIRKTPSLKDIQEKIAGKIPQWSVLEGKADEFLRKETEKK